MSKIMVENPKVFISYAWGTKEYQAKVLAFASDLVRDGIDVLLDKWSLKEGNDTYAFMEESVTNKDITNVLILLDPQYERKANERTGGVGTETQIISPEIYNKVKQDKFLPIIFERGDNGEVPKPTYLKGLLHFDLSREDTYDEEYQRLVKRLYGIEIVRKPKLGNRPEWLNTISDVSTKTRTKYNIVKENIPLQVKREKFELFLNEIKEKIVDFKKNTSLWNCEPDEYISLYNETKSIRDEYLQLLQSASYIDESVKFIVAKLEEICGELRIGNGVVNEIAKTLLHEMFIYTIAMYYKNKNYEAIGYILTKSYFVSGYNDDKPHSYKVFYFYNQHMDNAICKRDEQSYYSGTAHYWIDNINSEVCSKNDFVFADLLCYNAAILIENYNDTWYWFPITYVYGGYDNVLIRSFASKLQSKEHLKEAAIIFGFDDVNRFKERYIEIEQKIKEGKIEGYRYSGAFETAPILCYYTKSENLGIYK